MSRRFAWPARVAVYAPHRCLWSSLKAVELADLATPTLAEVIDQAHKGIERVRRTPHLAYSFLRPCRPVGHMTLNPTPSPSLG